MFKVAIRADASPEIGHGHVMRCLTLANKLARSGVSCSFLSACMPAALRQRIEKCGYDVHFADVSVGIDDMLLHLKPHWLVIDHYDIDVDLEVQWSAHVPGMKILVIDDLADRKHDCDVLVDMTPDRKNADYTDLIAGESRLLLGSDFALIGDEFVALRDKTLERRKLPLSEPHVLVTLGGGKFSAELETIAAAIVKVACENAFSTSVISQDIPDHAFSSLKNVEFFSYVEDMPERMSKADICIGAAGGTSWERCCLGLPTVAMKIADNQTDNFRYLNENKAALCVEMDEDQIARGLKSLLVSDEIRTGLAKVSSQICDGRGAARIRDHMVAQSLEVRQATLDDARFIYDARYDGNAARFYKSDRVPSFQEHCAWLQQALQDGMRQLWVVGIEGRDLAHVRFDRLPKSNQVEISLAISATNRGKGLGASILKRSCDLYLAEVEAEIVAEINPANEASVASFEKAGFVRRTSDGSGLNQYRLNRQ